MLPGAVGRIETAVVSQLREQDRLALFFAFGIQLANQILPALGQRLAGGVLFALGFGDDGEVGLNADRVEVFPKSDTLVIGPVRGVSDAAAVDFSNASNDASPVRVVLDGLIEFGAHDEDVGARRHGCDLDDPIFVVAKKPPPFFFAGKADGTAPLESRTPIGNVGLHHDLHAELFGFGNRAGDPDRWIFGIVEAAVVDATVFVDASVGMNLNRVDPAGAQRFHASDHRIGAPDAPGAGARDHHPALKGRGLVSRQSQACAGSLGEYRTCR